MISTWARIGSKYMYLYFKMLIVFVLRPKVLEKYQVHSSTLYLIKSYILYIDSSELCVDTIG